MFVCQTDSLQEFLTGWTTVLLLFSYKHICWSLKRCIFKIRWSWESSITWIHVSRVEMVEVYGGCSLVLHKFLKQAEAALNKLGKYAFYQAHSFFQKYITALLNHLSPPVPLPFCLSQMTWRTRCVGFSPGCVVERRRPRWPVSTALELWGKKPATHLVTFQ